MTVSGLGDAKLHSRPEGDASQTIDLLWIVTQIGGERTCL